MWRLEPRWTSENRPQVDTSKPANGAEPELDYLYLARGRSGKHFCEDDPSRFILASPGRRVRQRRDATGATTQQPEWRGGVGRAPRKRNIKRRPGNGGVETSLFAIESVITQAYERLSQRALGFFVVHVGDRRFGVCESDATMLGCSFDTVQRRVARRGTHTASFAIEPDAGKIADAFRNAVYAEDHDEGYFGIP